MKRPGCLRIRRAAALCGALGGLGGCALPPPRPPPPPPSVPASFHAALPAAPHPAALRPDWWESFHDPVLNQLVGRCLDANYDLQLADARFREARALWLGADTAAAPSIQAAAEYRRQHQPPDEKNKDAIIDQYVVLGFDASWEVDLFRRLRDRTAAAQANVRAQAAARGELAVSLAAEVARNYFELRGEQAAVAALEASVGLRARQLDLLRRREALGVANALEVAAARQRLDAETAELAGLRAAVPQTIHRLTVLTVRPADVLFPLLDAPAPPATEPRAPANVTPAAVLRQRADIRQAEEELTASSALAAAAGADLFPRLTFTGQFSFFAFGWGIGPNLTWDVFDRRRVRARQAAAGAGADAAFARYKLVVATAVAEVESALVRLSAARERRDALKAAEREARATVDLVRRRESLGVANRLDLVAVELAEEDAARAAALQEAGVSEAWVTVFKALGGGWTPPEH